MILAAVLLVLAVLAYGWSGATLAAGSREAGGALRSRAWWVGTALQGVGFVASLGARAELPLLLVQAAITAALAVTAVLEHAWGTRRLTRVGAAQVALVVAGVAAIAAAMPPARTRPAGVLDVVCLAAGLGVAAVCAGWVRRAGWLGLIAGLAFGCGAIASRLLAGGLPWGDVVRFWQWTPLTWAVALAMPAGIVVGQWALTRGLARGDSVATLGGDYLAAMVVPSAYGLLLLREPLHPWGAPLAAAGLVAALGGARALLRPPASSRCR